MVATRRGVRVSPPKQTDSDPVTSAQATPSTGRRTRSATKPPQSPTHLTVEEASSQLQKLTSNNSPPTPAVKRCTRASRLHSPDKPSTPMSSVHEGDVSDLESCCSAVSDIEPPVTRRSTRRQTVKEDDVSEAESCSSVVSASKLRRSTRRQTVKEDDVSEAESCSSVVSASKLRRSTRKKPVQGDSESGRDVKDDKTKPAPRSVPQRNKRPTRATGRPQNEDSEMSDVDSAPGDVSEATPRRSARARRKPGEDAALESSQSPALTTRRTRATRSKPETTTDVSMSCDSDGFESGPSYSRATRSRRASQLKVTDSDSDLTDVGKGTPSSSRTGSGRSNLIEQTSKVLSIVLEKALIDQEESMDESPLESTVVGKDAECTLIEESEEKEGRDAVTETKQESVSHLDKSPAKSSSINSHDESAPALDEAAVITEDQQEEPSAVSVNPEASEMEMIQETVQEPEPLQAAAETITPDSQITEDKDGEQGQEGEDVEMTEVSQTEASSVSAEAQQKAESSQESEGEEGPVQATSSQQHQATAESKPAVSLLDSSEDEDDEGDDFAGEIRASSEDEEDPETTTSVQARKTEVAKSVDGLFMIDTRPGQDADEQYYHDGRREDGTQEEEEEEEEFVDEEGDSDDDEADIFFSSRNPQVKELSSRIDPGVRMKELGGLYISFDGSKSKPISSSQHKTKEKKIQDEVMKKSVIGPDFEKKEAVPPYNESKHALKLKHRAEGAKTTGDAWFNMKAPELTPELKGDLQLLRMRGSMDSKQFYKKNDREGFPKYFQMGTVVDNPVDFYHSRVSKKDRKRTMVEELLADAEFRQKNKKKFQAIMAEKAAQAAGRRHKMKNKFHKK